MEAYRLGYYGGLGGRLIWTSPPRWRRRQPRRDGHGRSRTWCEARWTALDHVPISLGWVQGNYLLKLVSSDGGEAYVPFVLRNDSSTASLVLCTRRRRGRPTTAGAATASTRDPTASSSRGPGPSLRPAVRRARRDRPAHTRSPSWCSLSGWAWTSPTGPTSTFTSGRSCSGTVGACLARSRRVLVARDAGQPMAAASGGAEPRVPRRQRDLPAHPVRVEPARAPTGDGQLQARLRGSALRHRRCRHHAELAVRPGLRARRASSSARCTPATGATPTWSSSTPSNWAFAGTGIGGRRPYPGSASSTSTTASTRRRPRPRTSRSSRNPPSRAEGCRTTRT